MNPRNRLTQRLHEDLMGPLEMEELIWDNPTDVYLTGILFPRKSSIAEDENDQLQTEGIKDVDSNDVSKDEIPMSSTKRPSSMGVSFVVTSESVPTINIDFEAGQYSLFSDLVVEKDGREVVPWKRSLIKAEIRKLQLDFSSQDIPLENLEHFGVGLHVRISNWDDQKLVTVAAVNNRDMGEEYEKDDYEQSCLFQTKISISCVSGTEFCPRPIGSSAVDEDTQTAQLIYRDTVEYAVGHTCAAEWDEVEGRVMSVSSTWIPHFRVKAMSSMGASIFNPLHTDSELKVLNTEWLAMANGEKLYDGLSLLPDLYEEWLTEEEKRAQTLGQSQQNQANRHIEKARHLASRMTDAIALIRNDPQVETAFRLANQAIFIQRKWSNPSDVPLVWRPFQLGFILLTMESLIDPDHEDRLVADLLWFPTGGGKTEAYLGLIAFLLFYRRMKYGDRGAGVNSIMRYTLRLLTIQQFQRATALICACDAIRRGYALPEGIEIHFSNIPFSIGLWVGKDSTPNKVKDAFEALENEEAHNRPDQLSYCPRHTSSRLIWKAVIARDTVYALCPEPDCLWHNEETPLPVYTVDTDLYKKCPSLVLGTIDKFAQVARQEKSVSLFGNFGEFRAPEFIIQDELHLISGPLGTLAGLYEIAFDKLCSSDGRPPKIIASTATIRQASSQIKALFNRKTCLFPPPILDAGNSGFAIETDEDPGRMYLGITTAGRSAKFTLQAAAASVLQSAASGIFTDEERDDFWTMVTYFNSLRELGGALVLMQDDVIKSIKNIANRRDEIHRDISEPQELTSRVSQTEIKEVLENLNRPFDKEGCYDIILASNMISVGVDVPRLGVMLVNGQPKGIAEYIQATSRIGRRYGGPGGIVLSIYNNAKARDRSHFETFRTWHSALYREVEASSVTPFAPRAREKALHAVLVILARHLIPDLNKFPGRVEEFQDKLQLIINQIVERAETIDSEEYEVVEESLDDFLAEWISIAGDLSNYWTDGKLHEDLLVSAEKAAELKAKSGVYDGRATPTPNSMRNVEASTMFHLRRNLKD